MGLRDERTSVDFVVHCADSAVLGSWLNNEALQDLTTGIVLAHRMIVRSEPRYLIDALIHLPGEDYGRLVHDIETHLHEEAAADGATVGGAEWAAADSSFQISYTRQLYSSTGEVEIMSGFGQSGSDSFTFSLLNDPEPVTLAIGGVFLLSYAALRHYYANQERERLHESIRECIRSGGYPLVSSSMKAKYSLEGFGATDDESIDFECRPEWAEVRRLKV